MIGIIGLSAAASLVLTGTVEIDSLLMRLNRDPSPCLIKGDINFSGEQIYYLPDMPEYDRIMIATRRGEQWFCSQAEAEAASWRLPP